MKLDLIAATKKVLSLSRLRGRVGVGVSPRATLPEWREPRPGAPRRPKSELRSSRPPQAGEVKRACGQIDLIKTHHALAGRTAKASARCPWAQSRHSARRQAPHRR